LDGAGIGIGSTGNRKTFLWDNTNAALKSSENLNLASGKTYKVDGTDVLSGTTLGLNIVNSSLTSVGTLVQLRVTGISTFSNGPVLIGSGTSTGTANQRLQVTGGTYISGSVGIGSTTPTAALDVVGAGKFTDPITADLTGTADYANGIKGGDQGSILYQSATDTTSFLPADTVSGTVLINQGPGQNPIWGAASNISGFLSGLTIFDEETQVGNAKSFSKLKFVGSNINVIGSSLAGLATITISENIVGTSLSISGPVGTSGVSTIGFFEFSKQTGSIGIVTASYGTTIKYYGDGSNLSGTIPNSLIDIDLNSSYYPLLSQVSSGTISSISVASTSIVFNPGPNYLGIGSTAPKANLDVLGNVNISGIITSLTYFSGSFVGIASTARNLYGGTGGSIPYQSSANNTGFINAGDIGQILSSNGPNLAPSWITSAAGSAISGIAVYDEGSATPAGNAVTRLNFVGDYITATSSGVGATITLSSNIVGTSLSVGGISISSGIVTASSGIVTYYGDGRNLLGVTPGGVNIYNTISGSTHYIGIITTSSGVATGVNVSSSLLTFNPSTGNMVVGGTVTANSDEKLKTNIKTITNALEKVLSLRGVEYDRVDTGEHQIGVIAQEVEKIIPEVVYPKGPYPDYETKSVAYSNLIGLFIEAIKDLKLEIEELKKQIKEK
jgi:hypothetical protein